MTFPLPSYDPGLALGNGVDPVKPFVDRDGRRWVEVRDGVYMAGDVYCNPQFDEWCELSARPLYEGTEVGLPAAPGEVTGCPVYRLDA